MHTAHLLNGLLVPLKKLLDISDSIFILLFTMCAM